MNFNSLMIGTADAPAMAEYYTKLFGKPSMEDGGFTGWELGTGWMVIGPHDEVTGRNAQPGRVIWNIESADVLSDFARLRDAGAIVVREPYQPMEGQDMWITTLSDPDGNYFQLMSPM